MFLLSLEQKKMNQNLASLKEKEEVCICTTEKDIHLASWSMHFAHHFLNSAFQRELYLTWFENADYVQKMLPSFAL